MTNTDMDMARYILRESEKIFDLISMLTDEDDLLSRRSLSTMTYMAWTDLIKLRCDLEEMSYERGTV